MPSSFATREPALCRTPSYRQQVERRRLFFLCAVVGLALVGGVVGSLTHPDANPHDGAVAAGPFSYFPAQ
jgi:hypothetical protein